MRYTVLEEMARLKDNQIVNESYMSDVRWAMMEHMRTVIDGVRKKHGKNSIQPVCHQVDVIWKPDTQQHFLRMQDIVCVSDEVVVEGDGVIFEVRTAA